MSKLLSEMKDAHCGVKSTSVNSKENWHSSVEHVLDVIYLHIVNYTGLSLSFCLRPDLLLHHLFSIFIPSSFLFPSPSLQATPIAFSLHSPLSPFSAAAHPAPSFNGTCH